ncbi:MAG TPA: hypothetical protein VK911_10830 [Vicinamibacterales bacterium]|nr:hypothetical protein [Vicinamibacterales bacterium]
MARLPMPHENQPRAFPLLPSLLAACVAVAAWASGGVVALSHAGPGASRVGLLPAAWWLAALIPAALALVFFLHRRGRQWALAPAFLLAVLLLPWLPVPVPDAFLLWTGPLRWWIWAGAGAAVLVAAWPAARAGSTSRPAAGARRGGAFAAFALGLALFGAGAVLVSEVFPGGDEPHYLLIAQSLLSDGDLRIENNHERGDNWSYFPGRLRPHYLRRGQDGQIYSIHSPGLPAVIAPAFAMGGYPGVVAFLVILSALGMALVWRAGWLLTGSAGAAWFGSASVALTVPFFYQAFAVYPDGPGAVLVTTGVLALVSFERQGQMRASRLALHGAALALLPWLHTRYAVAAGVLGACVAMRILLPGSRGLAADGRDARAAEITRAGADGRDARPAGILAFLALPLVSAAAWFGFFRIIYGTFNPAAPYGTYTQSSLANVARGLPALLLDQQFGVIPNAPVYACALAGLALLFARRPRLAAEIALVVFLYLAAASSYQMWWGGWSAPARFAVPVLLALGVPASVFWARVGPGGRATGLVALGVSLLITATMALSREGWLIFNPRDGIGRWLDFVSPLVALPPALPSFLRGDQRLALLQSALWLVVLAAAAAAAWWLGRRPIAGGVSPRARLAFAAPPLFVAAAMLATALGWRLAGVKPLAPLAGQVQLLQAAASALPVGVSYDPLALVGAGTVPSRLSLTPSPSAPPSSNRALLVLGELPAGLYRLDPASVAAARGTAGVIVGRGERPVLEWTFDPSNGPREFTIALPVPVNALAIEGDEAAARTIPGLALQPVSVLPRGTNGLFDLPARRAAAYGSVAVYTFDDDAYLEDPGFWLRGGATVPVVLAAVERGEWPAAPLRLLVRNGPIDNRAELRSGRWILAFDLAAGEERAVEVPIQPGARAVPLEIRTERGFRPSETTPGSADTRYLGVWVEIAGSPWPPRTSPPP